MTRKTAAKYMSTVFTLLFVLSQVMTYPENTGPGLR